MPLIKSADYNAPQFESVEASRRRQAKKERRLKRFTALVLGWVAFGYVCYLIATTDVAESKIWDPYTILGISTVCSPWSLFLSDGMALTAISSPRPRKPSSPTTSGCR